MIFPAISKTFLSVYCRDPNIRHRSTCALCIPVCYKTCQIWDYYYHHCIGCWLLYHGCLYCAYFQWFVRSDSKGVTTLSDNFLL